MLLERIRDFGPSYSPEWGSGGVFGIKYHRGVLYFTLAFDGKAFFVSEDKELIYDFELIGRGRGSGGDTYNAVDIRDDEIIFGGWIHKPVLWKVENNKRFIDFSNKFSHIHSFDTKEWSLKLLWSESLRDPGRWCGEVTDLVYNPFRDSLLVARGDGFENLGLFELEFSGRKIKKLSDKTAVKGSIVGDIACFDISGGIDEGVVGVQCVDLETHRTVFDKRLHDIKIVSVDGGDVRWRGSGYAQSAYSRYFHFMRGGLLIVDPMTEEVYFIRLLDFGNARYTQPTPQRANGLVIGGGILAPFSSFSHSDVEKPLPVNSPSLLVYITPPSARIVGALGARITSLGRYGSRVLLGYSTHPNTIGPRATIIEPGRRGIIAVEEESLIQGASNTPLVLRFTGFDVGTDNFGGVPLVGYKRKYIKIKAGKTNKLLIYEYDIGIPPLLSSVESLAVRDDVVEELDLSGFGPIVSFKLENEDPSMVMRLVLE